MRERFDPYLGNAYSPERIEAVLAKYKLSYERLDDVTAAAARDLHDGKILGWFQGRDEFGPRALGNRSILANPTLPDMKDKVNEVVKYREGWRPFAPSMLASEAGRLLANIDESPYMILTDIATDEAADLVPAVVHVDGTLRPQTVGPRRQPPLPRAADGLPGAVGGRRGDEHVVQPQGRAQRERADGCGADVLYVGAGRVVRGGFSGGE